MHIGVLVLAILIHTSLEQSLFPCRILTIFLLDIGCSNGNVRCTTPSGIPQPLGETCFFNRCENGEWSKTIQTSEGVSCVENTLAESSFCNNPPIIPECDFRGIRCLADENILVDDICTSRYQECIDYQLSTPIILPGEYY